MKKCCRWCFLIRDEVPLSIRTRLVGATSIEFISKLIVFILGRWWSRFFVAKCWLQACQRKQSRELRAIITKIHTIGGLHRISGRRKKVKKIYLKLSSWAARRVKLWTRAHRCLGMRKTAVATRLAFHGEKIFFFAADRSQNGSCASVMTFPSWRRLLLHRIAASFTANDPNTANTLVPRVKDEMNWRRQEKKQISHSTRWLIAIHIPAVVRFRREKKRQQRVSFRGISLRRSCTDAD